MNLQSKSHNKRFLVILMGPPGSGKGTQSARLSRELNFPHISTGEILREEMRQGSALGSQAKGYIDKGLLVPDELVLNMLFERVARPDCKEAFILDGFPRTVNQAKALDDHFENTIHPIIVNLDVSDEVILKRISGRLSCKNCGKTYHKELSPPKKQGICDVCQGELYQRLDDSESAVKKRLQEYNSKTAPVLNFYAYRGLKNIDGARDPEVVYHDLVTLILALMEEAE